MEQPPGLVRTSLTETTAENMPAERENHIRTYTDGLKLVRSGWTVCQRYRDVILGVVLVLVGALKGHQLLTDPSAGLASGFPRELLIGASAFELAFGC